MRTLYRASRVHTLSHPQTGEWVLIDDRHVQRVGSGDPPDADRVVDLPGATILPGFIDTHVHLTRTGSAIANRDVEGAGSAGELLSLARRRASEGAGPVVMLGFDESRWDDPTHPALAALDAVTSRPLVIHRADGHMALANSARAGCRRHPVGPGRGRARRDRGADRAGHARRRGATRAMGVRVDRRQRDPGAPAQRRRPRRLERRDRGTRDVHAALVGASRPAGVPGTSGTTPDGREPGGRDHGYPADHGPRPAVHRGRHADRRVDRRPDRGADGSVRRLRRDRGELPRRRRARDLLPRRPHGRSAGGRPRHRRPGDRAGPRRLGTGLCRARFTRTPAFPRATSPHRTLRDGEHVADRTHRDARIGGVGAADVRPSMGTTRGDVRRGARVGPRPGDESVPHDDRPRHRGGRGIGHADHAVRPAAVGRGMRDASRCGATTLESSKRSGCTRLAGRASVIRKTRRVS